MKTGGVDRPPLSMSILCLFIACTSLSRRRTKLYSLLVSIKHWSNLDLKNEWNKRWDINQPLPPKNPCWHKIIFPIETNRLIIVFNILYYMYTIISWYLWTNWMVDMYLYGNFYYISKSIYLGIGALEYVISLARPPSTSVEEWSSLFYGTEHC